MRIALIHALKHSPPPIEAAFARLWPEAMLCNLLDDSLSADLAALGTLDGAMTERFLTLAHYAVGAGADGILFTCSAFGPCIERCAEELAPIPVLKPNEAMIRDIERVADRVGLLASFGPTLSSMPQEFSAGLEVVPQLIPGALSALDQGDLETHDRLALEAALKFTDVDVIALAQFSLARAAPLIAAETGKPVFTTPDSAVLELKRRLEFA